MRYSKEHKQATRQHIIKAAGRRFKTDGIDGSGIAALMADARLTNGAFYAHFGLFEVNRDRVSAWLPGVFPWRWRCVTGAGFRGYVMTCSACGKPIGPKDVQALPGPGAAEPLADRRLADAVLDQGLQNALALLSAGQQR